MQCSFKVYKIQYYNSHIFVKLNIELTNLEKRERVQL